MMALMVRMAGLSGILISLFTWQAGGQTLAPERIAAERPEFSSSQERPLRYQPDGTDFVIVNGDEAFNRPLYGGNTAFRIDAGDRPECAFYSSGRRGAVRVGIRIGNKALWLHQAARIEARYQPGSMLYLIEDPVLAGSKLSVRFTGLYDRDGLLADAHLSGSQPQVEIWWVFGGVSGKRGKRDGDLGCEGMPLSEFYAVKPDYCKGNQIEFEGARFLLTGPSSIMAGSVSGDSQCLIGDANNWDNLNQLITSANYTGESPVALIRSKLSSGQQVFLTIESQSQEKRTWPQQLDEAGWYQLYSEVQAQRKKIATQIRIETPDDYLNAAAAALCVATDAIWDEAQGAVMHGACAWRRKLLGWRGPYAFDALGWHDRMRRHLTCWAGQQDTGSIPPAILPADPSANLSRNEPSLHCNGTMSKSHYDMNLVYIDALFRHILWTGDLDFARSVWPVIERHLAWERRLFRRPYGSDGLPLYEAYAAIWASDDLQYSGGGVTHTTAYNYYHNKMAARLAGLLGEDGSAYEKEAQLIWQAMQRELWLADKGWFAEYKDWLGLRRTHDYPAVWTFYHTADSQAATARQLYQMSRYVDTMIPSIPIVGPGVPAGYHTISTSNWMPYSWSINNVVLAESAHTALAYWQSGRDETAFQLFKGCLLDGMYLGACPGNVGMCSYYDMARGESQRDFADGIGVTARTFMEGLFGIMPDALAGELRIRPGWPQDWDSAQIIHPDITLSYQRQGEQERYLIEPAFGRPMALQLALPAFRDTIASVRVNGQPAQWQCDQNNIGLPKIIIESRAPRYEVVIQWRGQPLKHARIKAIMNPGRQETVDLDRVTVTAVDDPQGVFDSLNLSESGFTGVVQDMEGFRTLFARVKQGDLTWTMPVSVKIRPEYELVDSLQQDDQSLRFRLKNNTQSDFRGSVTFNSSGQNWTLPVTVNGGWVSDEIVLPARGILPGVCPIKATLRPGLTITGEIINWHLPAASTKARMVDLKSQFNDKVTRIFQNEYVSPRSPFCSLAIPSQGIGAWCNFKETFGVDDTGLRAQARNHGGRIAGPGGIALSTPGEPDADNIIYVSLWDNYPDEATIPLTGRARCLYVLVAGSTNSMQSHIDNGEMIVMYTDNTYQRLALRHPTNWWPIDQDFYIDDYAFRRPQPIPPRLDLKTGRLRILDPISFKRKGGKVPGGSATILAIPLDTGKALNALTIRALSNEVVIGLMAATLID